MASDELSTSGDLPEDVQLLQKLYAERIEVKVEKRELGVVTARVETESREQIVNEDLTEERVEIFHVPIGRPVDACPPVRVEGDTTILSIVEEVLVITRQLVLKEEMHMKKVRTTRNHTEAVPLREQHAVISREASD